MIGREGGFTVSSPVPAENQSRGRVCGNRKKEKNKKSFREASRRLQYVPVTLLVILIAAFALYTPPQYGVFILVAVLVAFYVRSRKTKGRPAE